MIQQISVAVYAAGFLLLAYLVYAILSGLSGTPRFLRALFGVSTGYFALLAIAGVVEYWFAGYGSEKYYGTDVLAGIFAFAAFGAFRMFHIVSNADKRLRLLKGLGATDKAAEAARRGTVKTRVFVNPRGMDSRREAELVRTIRETGTPIVKDGAHSWHAKAVRIAPTGELLAPGARAFEDLIASACASGPVNLVIDLTKVTAMDSPVVEVIVSSYRHYREARFRIVAPPDSAPYRALALLGVEQMIPVEPALDARDGLPNV